MGDLSLTIQPPKVTEKYSKVSRYRAFRTKSNRDSYLKDHSIINYRQKTKMPLSINTCN